MFFFFLSNVLLLSSAAKFLVKGEAAEVTNMRSPSSSSLVWVVGLSLLIDGGMGDITAGVVPLQLLAGGDGMLAEPVREHVLDGGDNIEASDCSLD